MVTIKVTGTVAVALALGAVLFYFLGGMVKQIGELTGLVTLEDVGMGGIAIALGIVGAFLLVLVMATVDFRSDNRSERNR